MKDKQSIEIERLLNEVGKLAVKDLRANIERNDAVASGTLRDSVYYEVEENEEGKFSLIIDVKPPATIYAKYIEFGRSFPSRSIPPPKAIEGWMKIRGIDSKYLWPILINLKNKGWKRRGMAVFSPIAEKYGPILTKKLEASMVKEVEDFIKNTKFY